jgi:uncharacterized protein (TIGR02300 family)
VAKPELGTKRLCPNCGTKYYDLNREPIVCPNCGTVFVVAAVPTRAAERKPEPAPKAPVEPVEVEREENVISLEEVDEGEPDVVPEEADEEAVDLPVEEEIEVEADDTVPDPFLEEEEEEGDDVSGLLDVDAEDEEER